MPILYTRGKAAALLSLKMRALVKMQERGEIKARLIGCRYYIEQNEIMRILKERATNDRH